MTKETKDEFESNLLESEGIVEESEKELPDELLSPESEKKKEKNRMLFEVMRGYIEKYLQFMLEEEFLIEEEKIRQSVQRVGEWERKEWEEEGESKGKGILNVEMIRAEMTRLQDEMLEWIREKGEEIKLLCHKLKELKERLQDLQNQERGYEKDKRNLVERNFEASCDYVSNITKAVFRIEEEEGRGKDSKVEALVKDPRALRRFAREVVGDINRGMKDELGERTEKALGAQATQMMVGRLRERGQTLGKSEMHYLSVVTPGLVLFMNHKREEVGKIDQNIRNGKEEQKTVVKKIEVTDTEIKKRKEDLHQIIETEATPAAVRAAAEGVLEQREADVGWEDDESTSEESRSTIKQSSSKIISRN